VTQGLQQLILRRNEIGDSGAGELVDFPSHLQGFSTVTRDITLLRLTLTKVPLFPLSTSACCYHGGDKGDSRFDGCKLMRQRLGRHGTTIHAKTNAIRKS